MKKHTLALCLFLSLLAAVPTVAANLFSGSIWGLLTPKGVADLKTTPSGQQVLHVVIHHAVTPYYQIQLTHDVAAALPAGAVISYHFLARSPTKNTIHAVIEKRMSTRSRRTFQQPTVLVVSPPASRSGSKQESSSSKASH
jgi:hypothetical protein